MGIKLSKYEFKLLKKFFNPKLRDWFDDEGEEELNNQQYPAM